ncbi:MAG: selenide, water dikinase SelD [Defluviitaleaceae bacterium]|nr:selenide, water dikinase SelD [Defluviitaleaceae bacterium]
MDTTNLKKLTGCGGCTAKLPPGKLKEVLEAIPKFSDPNLLVGFDSSDDGAVYKLTDEIAIIKTLDFFPPMTDDPYSFGKIAAANSLSDVYAMGGEVKIALNIVCFPEKDDMAILGEILRGGAEKVLEAGGVLCGGHSINDEKIKYGLSVTGVVHPDKIYKNNSCKIGDDIILTKPLGIGIITSAYSVFNEKDEAYLTAIRSMKTLNKSAAEAAKSFDVSACTDVTGFGFLGHLNEMSNTEYTIVVDAKSVPYIPKAYEYAKEFIITAGGQKNRKFLARAVKLEIDDNPLIEILLDPQTSGGLLISLPREQSGKLLKELQKSGVDAAIVASVISREKPNIIVR